MVALNEKNCFIKSMIISVYEKFRLLNCENKFLAIISKIEDFRSNWNVYYCLKHGHVGT